MTLATVKRPKPPSLLFFGALEPCPNGVFYRLKTIVREGCTNYSESGPACCGFKRGDRDVGGGMNTWARWE